MHILGISTSKRPWGNTDILVVSALRAAKAQGATVEFLRAADLDLRPCTGCMRCLFKEIDCVIPDRFGELLAALRKCDGVVLGSPTYVLGANSVLHAIGERLIRFGAKREMAGKCGLVVASAGVEGWTPFVLPELTRFFLFLGIDLVDRFVGFAQGPGEILENTAALERAKRGGEALAANARAWLGEEGVCPVCRLDLVAPTPGGNGHCELCDLTGKLVEEGGRVRLVPEPGGHVRWSDEAMREHFEEKVLPSGPRFKARVKEFVAMTQAFKSRDEP